MLISPFELCSHQNTVEKQLYHLNFCRFSIHLQLEIVHTMSHLYYSWDSNEHLQRKKSSPHNNLDMFSEERHREQSEIRKSESQIVQNAKKSDQLLRVPSDKNFSNFYDYIFYGHSRQRVKFVCWVISQMVQITSHPFRVSSHCEIVNLDTKSLSVLSASSFLLRHLLSFETLIMLRP